MAATFRLATLLKVRYDRRDALRDELAQALQAGGILRDRIADVDAQKEALLDELRQGMVGEVSVDRLIETRRYGLVLRLERAELVRQVSLVDEETERRRRALVEADREVKTLERMQEQWQENEHHQALRRDQARLDELGTISFFRASVEGDNA